MLKVGVCLNKKEILIKVIENNGGIAKTSDFAANGINKYEVATFCKKGVIERIRRGFYQLPQSSNTTEEQLIRAFLPQGVICVESALFHYGYSDFSPREWSIAVPRTAIRAVKNVKNIKEFSMKAYYCSMCSLYSSVQAIDNSPFSLQVHDLYLSFNS
ncbi:MAG: hypothetical protein HFH48_10755 [Lachnospiraceae bacterium]|nr:hypothetical protein [Lachnospiraceae bacterium]